MAGETVSTFEKMPRPSNERDFAAWLVPARNNIQREMLRLQPIIAVPPLATIPSWVLRSRRLVLGACFSLWRSVFQARYFYTVRKQDEAPHVDVSADGEKFLNEIIYNNAATYSTELNSWSLEYYVENAVYRLKHARELAIEAGINAHLLPEPHMLGEAPDDHRGFFVRTTLFTPFVEWENCFHATVALISAMKGDIERIKIMQRANAARSALIGETATTARQTPAVQRATKTLSKSSGKTAKSKPAKARARPVTSRTRGQGD
jgi:hypothetical protein